MHKNLAAFTPTSGYTYYPPYISVNRVGEDAIAVTVRSPEPQAGVSGVDATITMPADELYSLARKIVDEMDAELPDGVKGTR